MADFERICAQRRSLLQEVTLNYVETTWAPRGGPESAGRGARNINPSPRKVHENPRTSKSHEHRTPRRATRIDESPQRRVPKGTEGGPGDFKNFHTELEGGPRQSNIAPDMSSMALACKCLQGAPDVSKAVPMLPVGSNEHPQRLRDWSESNFQCGSKVLSG